MNVPKELIKFGVRKLAAPVDRRLVAVCCGENATGKTDLLLRTGPRPLLIINIDRNLEPIEEKYIEDGEIIVKDVKLPRILNQEKDNEVWNGVRDLYQTAVEGKMVRSVLIDTGDAIKELLSRAKVGSLEFGDAGFMQANGAVNSNMKWLFNLAKDYRVNMLMTHRMADDYKDSVGRTGKKISVATGKRKMAGWKDSMYEAQMAFEMLKDLNESGVDRYKIRITKCNSNPDIEGMELAGSEITWTNLGMLAAPWSSKEEWR